MLKVIGIIIIILIAICGIHKSTTHHKVGYGLLVAWFCTLFFDSIHQKLLVYFQTHELAAEIYWVYLIWFLLIYGAIGIIEGLIRLVSDDFTFLGWISNLLKSKKRKQAFVEQEYNSADKTTYKPEECKEDKYKEELNPVNVIYPDKNSNLQQLGVRVSMLPSPNKIELQTINKEDVRAAAETDKDIQVTESNSFLEGYHKLLLKEIYWDHEIEPEVYLALREFISDEYNIIPHEALSNIFSWKWSEDWKFTDRVTKAHFDFAIYNRDFRPLMLIEVNGGEHKNNPRRIEMDEFKKRLTAENNLKLISIDATKTIGNVKKEVEERIRQEFPDRDSVPTYCPLCQSHIPMILQLNKKVTPNIYFYRCLNKKCGVTHSIGKSGEIGKIAPLYRNMPDKISAK